MRATMLTRILCCLFVTTGMLAMAGCQTTPETKTSAIDETLIQSAQTAERTGDFATAIDYTLSPLEPEKCWIFR